MHSTLELSRLQAKRLQEVISDLLLNPNIHRVRVARVELLRNHFAVNVTGRKADGLGESVPDILILDDGRPIEIQDRPRSDIHEEGEGA